MSILVTGGAGFIGFHLIQDLLDSGHRVVAIDNLSTGRRENLARFVQHPRFRFVEDDVRDERVIEPLIANADLIFNLAASVGVQKIFQDPIDCIENNTGIASVVLRLAAKYGRRLFMFSTSEIYGKSTNFPYGEDGDVTFGSYNKLRWSYACSKLLDDYLARAYFERDGLKVTTVRLFNTIGTYQLGFYGMVVPRFFQQALAGQPLTIHGDGRQSRCFTDVRDVVRAMTSLVPNTASYGELVNVGSDREISIVDLATKIIAMTGSRSSLEFLTYEQAYGEGFEDMQRRVPTTRKLKEMTQFEFRYSLEDTLEWILAEDRALAPGRPAANEMMREA